MPPNLLRCMKMIKEIFLKPKEESLKEKGDKR
jgi:hypothetical protein